MTGNINIRMNIKNKNSLRDYAAMWTNLQKMISAMESFCGKHYGCLFKSYFYLSLFCE